jgi:hypothetical protein
MFEVWIVCNYCDGLHKPRNGVCGEALIQHFAALYGSRERRTSGLDYSILFVMQTLTLALDRRRDLDQI